MPLSPNGEATALTALLTGRFISLHTAIPTGGAEVAVGAYARQAGGAFTQTGADPTTASNAAVIEFPVATAAWGLVNYVGVYSAVAGGTLLAYELLDNPKNVDVGDVIRFRIGQIKMLAN